MLNYKSFVDYQLEHKMAKTPENVITFYPSKVINQKGVVEELSQLSEIKHNGSGSASVNDIVNDIKPWDRITYWQTPTENAIRSVSW